jgi:hypothetical protein
MNYFPSLYFIFLRELQKNQIDKLYSLRDTKKIKNVKVRSPALLKISPLLSFSRAHIVRMS